MKHQVEEIDGEIFHIYFHSEQEEQQAKLLLEAKAKGTLLVGTYSYKKHQPHNSTGEYHLHVYDKSKQIFAINKSGTGHDSYHGTRMPNDVFNALKKRFSDWTFPDNQLIESQGHTIINDFRDSLYRQVKVEKHKDHGLNDVYGFIGYFHQFADYPFQNAQGFHARTLAIIEDMEGFTRLIPIDKFRFVDL